MLVTFRWKAVAIVRPGLRPLLLAGVAYGFLQGAWPSGVVIGYLGGPIALNKWRVTAKL